MCYSDCVLSLNIFTICLLAYFWFFWLLVCLFLDFLRIAGTCTVDFGHVLHILFLSSLAKKNLILWNSFAVCRFPMDPNYFFYFFTFIFFSLYVACYWTIFLGRTMWFTWYSNLVSLASFLMHVLDLPPHQEIGMPSLSPTMTEVPHSKNKCWCCVVLVFLMNEVVLVCTVWRGTSQGGSRRKEIKFLLVKFFVK